MSPSDRESPAWRGGAWWLLLLAGHVASLSLIRAGNQVGYQHYDLSGVRGGAAVAWSVLLLQAIAVGLGLRARWPALRTWLRGAIGFARAAGLLLALLLVSATVSKRVDAYVAELLVAGAIQVIALGNVVVAAWASAGAMERLGRWLAPEDRGHAPLIDRFAIIAASWVLVVGAVLATYSYQRHPHVPDEVVYLMHANYLASGHLTLPLPPAPTAFNIDLMHYEAARWYSPVPPGWPFVLAIGSYLGAPWLVNPVLGALCVLLAYATVVTVHGRRMARLTILLLATSPWFVFMSMNFMTHQLTLALALIAAFAVSRVRIARDTAGSPSTEGSVLRPVIIALAGGLAIGGVSLVRPLEGLAVALLLGVWSLPRQWWRLIRPSAWRAFAPSAALALGTVLSGALVRPYNRYMTGDPSYFPIMAYIDKYYTRGANDLGFGANRGLGWSGLDPFPGHGARDVVVNANLNITSINVELHGWATGSLVLLGLLIALRRVRRDSWWHLAVVGVIAGVHTFYWFSGGPDFGARYWYLLLLSLVVLSAQGADALGKSLDPASGARRGSERVVGVVATMAVLSTLTFFTWRAIDKYYHYRGMRPDIRTLVADKTFGRGLVFVRGKRHPDYASAVPYNPIDLRSPEQPVFAWAQSEAAVSEALRAYPDRQVWIVDGPTRTGRGFEVAAGPLSIEAAERALGKLGSQ